MLSVISHDYIFDQVRPLYSRFSEPNISCSVTRRCNERINRRSSSLRSWNSIESSIVNPALVSYQAFCTPKVQLFHSTRIFQHHGYAQKSNDFNHDIRGRSRPRHAILDGKCLLSLRPVLHIDKLLIEKHRSGST